MLKSKSSTSLEMMVFVTSDESRGPCATPGLRGWHLAEQCGGTGDVAQLEGAVCQGQRRGEPSLPESLCQGMFNQAHTALPAGFYSKCQAIIPGLAHKGRLAS